MVIVIFGLVVVVGGAVAFGVHHIREENSPGTPTSLIDARRSLHRSKMALVSSGAGCVCGGSLGPTGMRSRRYGILLGCTDCNRTWSENGRQVMTRRRPARGDQPGRSRRLSSRRGSPDAPEPQVSGDQPETDPDTTPTPA